MLRRDPRDHAYLRTHDRAKAGDVTPAPRSHLADKILHSLRHIGDRLANAHGRVVGRGGRIRPLAEQSRYHVFNARLAVTARNAYHDKPAHALQSAPRSFHKAGKDDRFERIDKNARQSRPGQSQEGDKKERRKSSLAAFEYCRSDLSKQTREEKVDNKKCTKQTNRTRRKFEMLL